ncbi:ABC transporter related [Prosthecochloris aestuarii DSM 271]|uniref:ABC transporter related n=2 Tax=Prosthecochloris TaxID=1101 RepID=B4S842_PROA2|nr:ABC transporter ATP-binding protein [Prosthecochloris aestuarii]ACF46229.1 ABC transporter related [Prosthecochloris aestuarii DSM 271]
MLSIENLHVSINGAPVLQGINLRIGKGETVILFGPNGSGKTTLLYTIMGIGNYTVTKGSIVYKGTDITDLPPFERARLGIGMSMQRPPSIHGLKTRELVTMCAAEREVDVEKLAEKVNMQNFLDRDINLGFSGGEIKRSEILQLMAQKPELVLFDEPESGVDVENMALVGAMARELLEGSSEPDESHSMITLAKKRVTSGLIITHTGYILDYITADRGHVLYNGTLCCSDNPKRILDHLHRFGYKECIRCLTQ